MAEQISASVLFFSNGEHIIECLAKHVRNSLNVSLLFAQ